MAQHLVQGNITEESGLCAPGAGSGSYGNKQQLRVERVLSYNMGKGTFDVSLLTIVDSILEV